MCFLCGCGPTLCVRVCVCVLCAQGLPLHLKVIRKNAIHRKCLLAPLNPYPLFGKPPPLTSSALLLRTQIDENFSKDEDVARITTDLVSGQVSGGR